MELTLPSQLVPWRVYPGWCSQVMPGSGMPWWTSQYTMTGQAHPIPRPRLLVPVSLESSIWPLDPWIWSLESWIWALDSESWIWALDPESWTLKSGIWNLSFKVPFY